MLYYRDIRACAGAAESLHTYIHTYIIEKLAVHNKEYVTCLVTRKLTQTSHTAHTATGTAYSIQQT